MISVIIPTYCESDKIGSLVDFFKKSKEELEVIVSDGGSNDNTVKEASNAGAITVFSSVKGRAAQMNCGAAIAKGDVLYFVHADTLPPASFATDIKKAVNSGYDFGRYQTKFLSDKTILKVNAFFTRFDLFVCYGGDQTLFITADLFKKVGGYKEDMLIMEDYDIVSRAKVYGKYRILNNTVLISARKYEENSWLKVQLANRKIVSMYKAGAGQQEMVNKYQQMLNYR